MKLVDVNVLLYVINEDSPHHDVALAWWTQALAGDEGIGVTWGVSQSFLRLVTHRRIFVSPQTPQAAAVILDEWFAHPNIVPIAESSAHWPVLRKLLKDLHIQGDLVADANLAALAIHHKASVVSFDGDFARFPQLTWEIPSV